MLAQFTCIILLSAAFIGCGKRSINAPQIVSFDVSPQNTVTFTATGNESLDLYLLNLKTNKVRRLTDTLDFEMSPSFDPTGKLIAYAASRNPQGPYHIFFRSLDGKNIRQLTSGSGVCDLQPRFSPDGSRIVFTRAHRYRRYKPHMYVGYTWDNYDIYVLDVSSGWLQRITNQNYYQAGCPSFCEDGKTIVFSATVGARTTEEVIMSVDSSQASSVPKRITDGWSCHYSIYSKQITYNEDRKVPYDYEVWKMHMDGQKQKQITNLHSYIYSPVFAPDGKTIMFISDPKRNNLPELWRISVNGGKPHKVAGSELFYHPLSWKP